MLKHCSSRIFCKNGKKIAKKVKNLFDNAIFVQYINSPMYRNTQILCLLT